MRILLFILLLSSACFGQPNPNINPYKGNFALTAFSGNFTFSIPNDGSGNPQTVKTSAGVFQNGVLIRTLWSQRDYTTGSYNVSWDRKDYNGNIVSNTTGCTWKVKYDKVQYDWKGVIGNTSDSFTGTTVHHGYEPVDCMTFRGDTCYYGTSYNEQLSMMWKFNVNTPQKRYVVDYAPFGSTWCVLDCTNDGTNCYWAGVDPNSAQFCVYGTAMATNTRITFANGTTASPFYDNYKPYSVIAYSTNTNDSVTKLSCQKAGNYIFALCGHTGTIKVLNKTGTLAQTVTISGAKIICVDSTDNHAWIAVGNTAKYYTINSDGTLTLSSPNIVLSYPIVGMSINNTSLILSEGGTSQIVRAFDPATGAALWTKGTPGGYMTSATVTDDKFYWHDLRRDYLTFVSHAPDGSFWVGDSGNDRVQHYNADRTFNERIMYIEKSYSTSLDYRDSTHVFGNFLEFKIDYTKALAPNNVSWTLVNNWGAQVSAANFNQYFCIRNPTTFPNGHRFCFLNSGSNWILMEMNSDGSFSNTGRTYPNSLYLDKSMNLYRLTTLTGGQTNKWYVRTFSGSYYSDNTPVWNTETLLAESPAAASVNDPGYNGNFTNYRPNVITTDSTFVLYNPGLSTGLHTGGVKNSVWSFKTQASTTTGYTGNFPAPDSFDIGNSVFYPGSVAIPFNNTFFTGYNGEHYKQSQTNKWNHYDSDGLPIGQFGVANGKSAPDRGNNAYYGDAGNPFSGQVITFSDGTAWLVHNDESMHGGIHVWKISNMGSVQNLTGNF